MDGGARSFQCRDDQDCDDHHQHPGTDFVGPDDRPMLHLRWVDPAAEISADILGDPDKKADQDE